MKDQIMVIGEGPDIRRRKTGPGPDEPAFLRILRHVQESRSGYVHVFVPDGQRLPEIEAGGSLCTFRRIHQNDPVSFILKGPAGLKKGKKRIRRFLFHKKTGVDRRVSERHAEPGVLTVALFFR